MKPIINCSPTRYNVTAVNWITMLNFNSQCSRIELQCNIFERNQMYHNKSVLNTLQTNYVSVVCSEVNKTIIKRCSGALIIKKKMYLCHFSCHTWFTEKLWETYYLLISLLKAIKFQRCGPSSTSSSFYMNDVSTGDNKQISINDSVAR